MSRKQMLQGLMHAAEQGRKMREGTNLAESGPRGQVTDLGSLSAATKGVLSPFDKVFGAKIPNTTYVPTREPNPTQTHVPGKGTNPHSTVGFAPVYNKVSDPNENIRRKMEIGNAGANAEQARREQSEKKMRELSAPDSAMRREKELPSELRRQHAESYANSRLDIILETVSRILEGQEGKKGEKPDFLDFDRDGNTTEPMVDAIKDANKETKKFRVPPAASTKPDRRTRSQIEIEHGAIP